MLGLIGVLGAACASCALDDVVTAKQRLLMPEALVSQQATDGCTRFALKVVNGTATVEPLCNSTGCQSDSLRLETDTAAVYDASTATLRVPLVIRNLGGTAIVAPARVRFLADSAHFLDNRGNVMAGTPNIVATNYDSASANGRSGLWRYDTLLAPAGQVQTLPPNGVSRRKWLEFSGSDLNRVIRIKLPAISTLAPAVPAVPAVAPDTLSAGLSDNKNVAYDSSGGLPYVRHHLLVHFRDRATQAQRQSAIAAITGVVVGGARNATGDGYYLVRVPADSSAATVDAAVRLLTARPEVRLASRYHVSAVRRTPSRMLPTAPPDTVPAWVHDSANFVVDTSVSAVPIQRNVMAVVFRTGASASARQALMDSLGGVVVGGARTSASDGDYYLQFSSAASIAQLIAIRNRLRASAWVDEANLILRNYTRPSLLRPGDAGVGTSMPSRPITLSTTALSSSDLVQAIPPDSVPVGLYSSVNIVDDTAFTGGPILKDVLTIEFAPAATVAARRALIDSIGGTVIGGGRTSATTGFYYVRIVPRPTLQRLHSIVARLRGSPLVDESGVVPAVDVPREYRPAYRWRRMDRARDNHRGAHPDSIPPSPLYFPP